MPEQPIDVVRGHIEAYQRADAARALSYLDPHVVFDPSRVGVLKTDAGYGPEGVAKTVNGFVGAFEEYSYEVERLTDLGAGVILAIASEGGRGRGSGVEVRRPLALVYSVLDQRITRITVFPDEDAALAAVSP